MYENDNETAVQTNEEISAATDITATEEKGENLSQENAFDNTLDSGKDENSASENAEEARKANEKARNAEYARKRREEERQKELKRMRLDSIKEVLDENPYTMSPIETDEDVEDYLIMKELDKEGQDPTDISAFRKKQREMNKKSVKDDNSSDKKDVANDNATADEKAKRDIDEFIENNPDVDINTLLSDKEFMSFADGILGNVSLNTVYSKFLLHKGTKAKLSKQAAITANRNAAVGSLSGEAYSPEKEYFTRDEVKKMTPEEIKKNYDKIRKSQEKWQK